MKTEHWIVTPNSQAVIHSCQGTTKNEIAQRQMRQFTKEKFHDGISDLKTISNLSGIKNKFADYGAEIIGDADKFQRVIQRKRKLGAVGAVPGGEYPEEFKKMKKFNQETYTLINEDFLHEKTFQYFFLPEFIPLLSGVISGDGTFSPVRNTDDVYQIYVISAQLYDSEKTRTHLQPIMCILLPNKRAITYKTMWEEIYDFYCSVTGENSLMPLRFHCDNESAVLKTFKLKFPNSVIVTCLFHLKSNFKK